MAADPDGAPTRGDRGGGGADRDLLACEPEEAAARAIADPPLIAVLLDAMRDHDDADVRFRAADAAEKAARERPDLLAPHADALVDVAEHADQHGVRWHAAQMLARTELSAERARHATEILERYLADDSRIVEAWALSAITAIANAHPELRARAKKLVEDRLDSDHASVSARARMLQGQADSWPAES
jgi:hypothetical protein